MYLCAAGACQPELEGKDGPCANYFSFNSVGWLHLLCPTVQYMTHMRSACIMLLLLSSCTNCCVAEKHVPLVVKSGEAGVTDESTGRFWLSAHLSDLLGRLTAKEHHVLKQKSWYRSHIGGLAVKPCSPV